jgi:hypothetical protein
VVSGSPRKTSVQALLQDKFKATETRVAIGRDPRLRWVGGWVGVRGVQRKPKVQAATCFAPCKTSIVCLAWSHLSS